MKLFLLGSFVNIFSKEELNDAIFDCINSKKKACFFCLNTYSIYLLKKNQKFSEAFNSAEYIIPDGISVVYAAKILLKKKLNKVRINSNFLFELKEEFIRNQTRIFLLGSKEEILIQAVKKLKNLNINVVGWHNGYNIDSNLINKINNSNPEAILVGMGMPKQEIWAYENFEKLNCSVILTVGNLIDIIAGKTKIAPNWITNTPFEWFYRLFQEPGRLLPRYLRCHPYFIYLLIKEFFSIKRS